MTSGISSPLPWSRPCSPQQLRTGRFLTAYLRLAFDFLTLVCVNWHHLCLRLQLFVVVCPGVCPLSFPSELQAASCSLANPSWDWLFSWWKAGPTWLSASCDTKYWTARATFFLGSSSHHQKRWGKWWHNQSFVKIYIKLAIVEIQICPKVCEAKGRSTNGAPYATCLRVTLVNQSNKLNYIKYVPCLYAEK